MIPANKILPAVAIWGILQLVLLGIGASGYPLWAHDPIPHESLALPILLCGQILLLSMLTPVIASSWQALVINLVLMLPFDQLSGVLSNSSEILIAKSFSCVALWGFGLGLWQQRWQVTPFATLLAVGGVIFDYLRWESFLADNRPGPFLPVTLLPSIVKENWGTSYLEAALPAVLTLVAITGRKVVIKQFSPLHSTADENSSKSAI